jgi:predicted transcriptional regulator
VADPSAGRVALLSIKPRFVRSILGGNKRVELRRVAFSEDVRTVVMYSTAPEGYIAGWFSVSGVDRLSPSGLWERHKHHAGVTRREFRSYFQGSREGVAIRVGHVTRLERPAPLSVIDGLLRPPQSFCYIDSSAFSRLTPFLQPMPEVEAGALEFAI